MFHIPWVRYANLEQDYAAILAQNDRRDVDAHGLGGRLIKQR
jgi:hypothetical protein